MPQLGIKIKFLRKRGGWTQGEMAAKLGTSQGYVSDIEIGKVKPGIDILLALKSISGCSLDWVTSDTLNFTEEVITGKKSPYEGTGGQMVKLMLVPSNADSKEDKTVSLDGILFDHKDFVLAFLSDDSMNGIIPQNSFILVDRRMKERVGDIVLCNVAGRRGIFRIVDTMGRRYLYSENSQYAPIPLTKELDYEIEGVVTWNIRNITGNQFRYEFINLPTLTVQKDEA